MRKVTKTQSPVIHFRRWSRKRYAAFCSIGRCVSIRQLKKNLSEASLMKQKPSLAISLWRSTDEPDIYGEVEEPDLPPSLFRFIALLIQPQTSTEVCGHPSFVLNKPDNYIAGQMPYHICPVFYLYHLTIFNV